MIQGMRVYEMKIYLPFLPKSARYAFDDELGFVYRMDGEKLPEYPLRAGLGGYLNLLLTVRGKYLKEVKQ
jgi:hypothetical protein